jgi:hypothetical protein
MSITPAHSSGSVSRRKGHGQQALNFSQLFQMNSAEILSPEISGGICSGVLSAIRCIELIEAFAVANLQKILTSQNGHGLSGAVSLVQPSLSLSSFHQLSLRPGDRVLSVISWSSGDVDVRLPHARG